MRPTCGCSFFYLSNGEVWVCEMIELSHMGRNNGNPDLVCEKESFHMGKTAETSIRCARKGSLVSRPIRFDVYFQINIS